jgi:hypothetical protein
LPRETPVRRFGSYELLEEIDRGGMGIVYRARQPDLDRLVALKMILSGPAAEREEVLRFQREARAAGRLRHANIIAIHDAGTIDGQHYFTMPLARNGSLAAHVKRLGADPRAAVGLVEKVARAVQHAHDNGILHRDLKPANILLDEGDEPWVADFGLAKFQEADESLTRTGRRMGTPAYMAPEQSSERPRASSPATDVWALGVILYELLTGRRPFRGRYDAVVHKIQTEEPVGPRCLRSALDVNLEAIVLKCLSKDPAQRYDSAGVLADDLHCWLRGELPSARPEGTIGRARRWLRRHAVAVIAALLLLPLAAALPFLWPHRGDPAGVVSPDEGSSVPPLVTDPDPDEALAHQKRDLDAGHVVTLIGPSGGPRKVQPILTNDKFQLDPDAEDGFHVEVTRGYAYLELMPQTPPKGFIFRAEVANLGGGGAVGLAFGHSRQVAPTGPEDYFGEVSFLDRLPGNGQQVMGRLDGHLWRVGLPKQGPGKSHLDVAQTFPSGEGVFHALVLQVAPAGVRVLCRRQDLGSMPQEKLFRQANNLALDAPFPTGTTPDFGPGGGIGLFVTRARAAFRNVTVEPLREQP